MKAVIAKFITLYCLIALECARAQTWTLTSANPTFSWTCVASSADGNKLAGTAGGIYLSTNSGAAWITSSAPAAAWSSIASSADGARLIAANGSIYISTNSGGTWTASKPPGNLVASSADGSKLMAVQATGLISVSTNSGYTWFLGTNLSRSWSRIA
ncbi:MAG TPA: hypothetical protein VGV18_01915, partial [Verrucomicrobiae bacterium]|nr:hypothetical protein [Verrucomicrobiae bacterium]